MEMLVASLAEIAVFIERLAHRTHGHLGAGSLRKH
jgi:hypothetical protein